MLDLYCIIYKHYPLQIVESMSVSVPAKRRELSNSKQIKRSKSSEVRRNMGFMKQENNEISINTILEQTVKSSNQAILASQSGHRQSSNASTVEMIEESNTQIAKDFTYWEILKIEEKRKIKGIKAKLQWCNGRDSWIMLRVILTDNYIRMNQPEYFLELDSANMEISMQEQKLIQQNLNFMVEEEQTKVEQLRSQMFSWLKSCLIEVHNQFVSMRINTRKKTKVTQFKRSKLNQKYVLYPSPASLTWSPHGMLCITENKVGAVTGPIVGSVYSYRSLIESPYRFERFSRMNNQIEDLKMVEERKEDEYETTEDQFFGWNVKEEINFSIFGRLVEDDIMESKQAKSLSDTKLDRIQKKGSKDYETCYMGNTNNMTSKLQKIYRRFFGGSYENPDFEFLEKLKIFIVKSQSSELQDGISYLIDKIQRHDRSGVVDALMENEFTGFHAAFTKTSKKENQFERLKYELASQFLQEKIRKTPQSQHFLYMKSVMIENEFFRLALEKYFEENLRRLHVTDRKYEQLGSFDNFDDFKAQSILFSLIDEILKAEKSLKDEAVKVKQSYRVKPEKYDDPDYLNQKYQKIAQCNMEMKLILKGYVKKVPKTNESMKNTSGGVGRLGTPPVISNQQRNVNLNMMPFLVVNKAELSAFQFNMILNANQRKKFLETVIPILWIKDRSSDTFQYKLAKRVIIANAKIINFTEKLNNIFSLYKKMEGGRRSTFLKIVSKEYHRFEKRSSVRGGKVYTAYCQRCGGDFIAYNLLQVLRITKCSRCKYLQGCEVPN